MMGYHTLTVDRIANEGALFTEESPEQSRTAGRTAFIDLLHRRRTIDPQLRSGLPVLSM
jgi:hypothetical protein